MTFTSQHFLELFGHVRRNPHVLHIRSGKGKDTKRLYLEVKSDLTDGDIIKHIGNRRKAVVVHLNHSGGACNIGCIDVDVHIDGERTIDRWPEVKEAAQGRVKEIIASFKENGIDRSQLIVEYTGGFGYHIWFPVEITMAYQMSEFLRRIAGDEKTEIFPEVKIGEPQDIKGPKIRLPQGYHAFYSSPHNKNDGRSIYVDSDFNEIVNIDTQYETIIENRPNMEWFENNGCPSRDFVKKTGEGESYEYSDIIDDNGEIDAPDIENLKKEGPQNLKELFLEKEFPECFRYIYNDRVELFLNPDIPGKERWKLTSACALHIFKFTASPELVHEFLKHQTKYTRKETNKELIPLYNKWKRGGIIPHGCDTIQSLGGEMIEQNCDSCSKKCAAEYRSDELNDWLAETAQKNKDREMIIDNGYDRNTLESYEIETIENNKNQIAVSVEYLTKLTNDPDGRKKTIFISEYIETILEITKRLERLKSDYMILYGVRELVDPEICQAGLPFINHPELRSIPFAVCKNSCERFRGRGELTLEVREYIDNHPGGLYLDKTRIDKIADEMDTCSKCLAPVLLKELEEEPITIMLTAEKMKNHLFLRDSGVIDSISGGLVSGKVVLGMEYINTKIPKHILKTQYIHRALGPLEAVNKVRVRALAEELKEKLADKVITVKDISDLILLRDIEQYLYLEDKVDKGIMRSIIYPHLPKIIIYSYQSGIEIKSENNTFPSLCTSPLYVSAKDEIKNRIMRTHDGVPRAPMPFRNILDAFIEGDNLYMPISDPVEAEIYGLPILSKDQKKEYILNNSSKNIITIHSRKIAGEYYLGDTTVAPGTHQPKRDENIIEDLQYHRASEREIVDCIDLNGGDFRLGAIQFVGSLFDRSLRYGNVGNPDHIGIPWDKTFGLLDFKPNMKYITQYELEQDMERNRKDREKVKRYRAKKKLKNSGGER